MLNEEKRERGSREREIERVEYIERVCEEERSMRQQKDELIDI